jgi:hypothetical protein
MSLVISKAQSEITHLQTGRYVYGDEVKIYVETNVNGNLTVKAGDSVYIELPIAANQLKNISLGVLDIGSYDVVVKLFAGKNYIPSNETRKINVLYKLEDKDVNITVPEVKTGSESIVVKLPSDATGDLRIIIGDNNYPFGDIIDGVASYKVPSLANGDYNYTIIYFGNEKYTNYTSSGILKVDVPVKTTLSASDVSTVYGSGKYLVATLKDNTGNVLSGQKLTVVIGSKTFTPTTDNNGQVKVSTNGLAPNTYRVTISFAGNENYTASNTNASVTVNKDATSLTSVAVSTVYNVAKKLVVTLKGSNGVLASKKVTIKVGTISKTLTTNSKGEVSVDISTLAAKAYTASVKFAGDANYKASSKSVKVTVKKANTKLVTSNKAFKVKATKKVTATLKDSKNRVIKNRYVTFKVAGKTYKVKTNSKGVATVAVKITKKGSFSTAVSFAGDAYYNKCSKSIKITVK